MTHEGFSEKLLRYFYEELSSEERADFEKHLSECELCQEELKQLKSLSEELALLSNISLTREETERILSKAEKLSRRNFYGLRLSWAFSGAIAVITLIILSIFFIRDRNSFEGDDFYKLNSTIAGIEEELNYMESGSETEDLKDEITEIQEELVLFYPESSLSEDELNIIETNLEEIEEISEGILEI